MGLKEVRSLFREGSGRYDLVSSADANLGADKYINMGLRYLDGRQKHQQTKAAHVRQIQPNQYWLDFDWGISVLEVWLTKTNGDRIRLEKRSEPWIRGQYKMYSSFDADLTAPGNIEGNSTDTGVPSYWAPRTMRLSPEDSVKYGNSDGDTQSNFGDFDGLRFGDVSLASGILLAPLAKDSYAIRIVGEFRHAPLVNDEDENFWTEQHPEILALASLYKLEALAHRNSQGQTDYLNAINEQLLGIEFDTVRQEIAEVKEMKG